MMDEHDARLQRIFDERLMRVLPPPRVSPKRRPSRVLAAAVALLVAAGAIGFAADVNATADAAGDSCADVMVKVKLWFASVQNATDATKDQVKRSAGELVGQSCTKAGDETIRPGVKVAGDTSGCVADDRIRSLMAGVESATPERTTALKQQLAEACSSAK